MTSDKKKARKGDEKAAGNAAEGEGIFTPDEEQTLRALKFTKLPKGPGKKNQGFGIPLGGATGLGGTSNKTFIHTVNQFLSKANRQPQKTEQHPGRFLSHYPLRLSLVAVITVLVGMGLFVSSAAVAYTMGTHITSQVDERLKRAAATWAQEPRYTDALMRREKDVNIFSGVGDASQTPTDFFLTIFDDNGHVYSSSRTALSKPDAKPGLVGREPDYIPPTRDSLSERQWRGYSIRDKAGQEVVLALPLEDEGATIEALLKWQFIIGSIVLLFVILSSLYVVRRALRPLNQIEETASKIASGDLSRRVPDWAPRTEAGRLSVALNRMLAQIQGAFVAVSKAAQLARHSEDSMRRFIGDASHELRTPLTSVRGYAELYQSGATQDANMVIQKISDESGRMILLVEDLLALVRMDEGRPLEKSSVDMLEVAVQVVDSARAGFPGRQLEIRNLANGIPMVQGDVNRLHQVLGNLVTNGLRHAGEDATVTIILRDEPGKTVIDIEDNGCGIPEEDLPRLFDRFYRPDVSRSRSSGGSGLGLAIVKGIVDAHDGDIAVSSEVGEGTTFRVWLPAVPEDAADAVDTVDAVDAADNSTA